MATRLVTAPALEPVSLSEAKGHCRVAIADDDGLLAGYVLAARTHIEGETRRAFMTQTWDATFDDFWPRHRVGNCYRDRIVLPRPPVQSVTSVSYVDVNGVTQTLASNQYKVAKSDTGEWVIDPAFGVTWPTVRREMAAITVRFVAGYDAAITEAFPEQLRQAILLLTQHFYENREPVNIGNIVNEIPLSVQNLVFPFRVFY